MSKPKAGAGDAEALRRALSALEQIRATAEKELGAHYGRPEAPEPHAHEEASDEPAIACTPRRLPSRLAVRAAETASRINPANAPRMGSVHGAAAAAGLEPARIAMLVSKYWGPQPRTLTVSFMESTPADLRRRILSHMNAWAAHGCVSFAETQGTGVVRVTREDEGYWSYMGTDVLHIPASEPTLCLQGFTMATPERTYRRVVRHEAGHALGFVHEHMRRDLVARIDPQRAYDYFLRWEGWDRRTVDEQVLTAVDERSVMGTPADTVSIMTYQLPGSITRDGRPILGGTDIDASDRSFCARVYPKAAASAPPPPAVAPAGHAHAAAAEGAWAEAADVTDPQIPE